MSSITLITFAIWVEAVLMSPIDSTMLPICSLPAVAIACFIGQDSYDFGLSAFDFALEAISVKELLVC